MKIGIFDSGIGGLSVLDEAVHRLSGVDYIFYADIDHVPYGLKTPEQITEYVDDIAKYLIENGVDAIVIACNTATSVAAKRLRSMYSIPIIGMEPAVKPAVQLSEQNGKRALVMATPVTIRENKLKTLLERVDKNHVVDLLPMPGLVRFAESGVFSGKEVEEYLDEQLGVLDKSKYGAVVLGCTHFNYFKQAIKSAFGNITLLDGNVGTIKQLAKLLNIPIKSDEAIEKEEAIEESSMTFIESGREVVDMFGKAKYEGLLDYLSSVRDL